MCSYLRSWNLNSLKGSIDNYGQKQVILGRRRGRETWTLIVPKHRAVCLVLRKHRQVGHTEQSP